MIVALAVDEHFIIRYRGQHWHKVLFISQSDKTETH